MATVCGFPVLRPTVVTTSTGAPCTRLTPLPLRSRYSQGCTRFISLNAKRTRGDCSPALHCAEESGRHGVVYCSFLRRFGQVGAWPPAIFPLTPDRTQPWRDLVREA